MKNIFLVIVLIAFGYSEALPTIGLALGSQRPPSLGWSENAGGLYPVNANPYGNYGYDAASPVYIGSYSQSPSFPGYVPGLYGLPYLNLRGR